jgi:predicted anti-sigma-YlaC factor YlaD
MSCKETGELLSTYLDRQLPEADRLEVQRHVESCAACANDVQALLQVKEMLRQQPMPSLPAEVIARIEEKTIHATPWWQMDLNRYRWIPIGLSVSAALGAWMLFKTLHNIRLKDAAYVTVARMPLRHPKDKAQDVAFYRVNADTATNDLQ